MKSSNLKLSATLLVLVLLNGSTAISAPAAKPAPPSTNTSDWKADIDKARTLIVEKKFKEAEVLLKIHLPEARKAGANTQLFGRYLGLYGNALFNENMNQEMIPITEEALRTFYALPPADRPPANVFFSNHSNLAMSYQKFGKLKQAEQQYFKAISAAQEAKSKNIQINQDWLKICFDNLAECFKVEKNAAQEKKVLEMKKKAVAG